MNCKEALEKLYEFLDKELDKVPTSEIQRHLDSCRHCWNRFDFEKQLKALVKKFCSKQACPDTLRRRIYALLEKY